MKCQSPIPYGSAACPSCGQRYMMAPPGGQRLGDDAGMRALLPVGRTALSIVAGYLGLVCLVFFFLGPIALLVGILAVRDLKRQPGMHGMGRAIFGIVMGSLGTAVLLLLIAVKIT
jgi:hypothetical protein